MGKKTKENKAKQPVIETIFNSGEKQVGKRNYPLAHCKRVNAMGLLKILCTSLMTLASTKLGSQILLLLMMMTGKIG